MQVTENGHVDAHQINLVDIFFRDLLQLCVANAIRIGRKLAQPAVSGGHARTKAIGIKCHRHATYPQTHSPRAQMRLDFVILRSVRS